MGPAAWGAGSSNGDAPVLPGDQETRGHVSVRSGSGLVQLCGCQFALYNMLLRRSWHRPVIVYRTTFASRLTVTLS